MTAWMQEVERSRSQLKDGEQLKGPEPLIPGAPVRIVQRGHSREPALCVRIAFASDFRFTLYKLSTPLFVAETSYL